MTKHTHHITPKHAGGSNDLSNLIELSIEEHAEAHKELYEIYGRWEDYLAWQGLSGMLTREELIRKVQSEAAKATLKKNGNPFSGIRTSHNFAINNKHQRMMTERSRTPEANAKRKATMAANGHSQGTKNSQYGKRVYINPHSKNKLKVKPGNEPEGYILLSEFESKRLENSKLWFNDGDKNFHIKQSDPRVKEMNLVRGRLNKSTQKLSRA